jgi:hypothetical protein
MDGANRHRTAGLPLASAWDEGRRRPETPGHGPSADRRLDGAGRASGHPDARVGPAATVRRQGAVRRRSGSILEDPRPSAATLSSPPNQRVFEINAIFVHALNVSQRCHGLAGATSAAVNANMRASSPPRARLTLSRIAKARRPSLTAAPRDEGAGRDDPEGRNRFHRLCHGGDVSLQRGPWLWFHPRRSVPWAARCRR